jgi:hypothetical protein
MQLTAQILKDHGFKAVIKGTRVEVSLRKRQVYPHTVMMVIIDEELPISETSLVYACGNTYIKFS